MNAVVAEIAPWIIGRRVSGISSHGTNLEVGLGDGGALVVCLEPAAPGLYHTTDLRKRRKQTVTATEAAAARFLSTLTGAEVTGISKEPFDRIIRIGFTRHHSDGHVPAPAAETVTLVLRLTGRSANVYVEEEGGNRDAMLPARGRPAHQTPAACGAATENMDPHDKADPTGAQANAYAAFGPALKAEIVARSQDMPPEEALASLLDDLERRPTPLIYSRLPIEEVGKRPAQAKTGLLLSSVELAGALGLKRYEFDSFSEAADSYYRLRGRAVRFDREYEALLRKLGAEIKKSRLTLDAVEADLEKVEQPERFRRYGDLILANLATAKIEQGRIRVRDYYDPDAREIEIDVGDSKSLQDASSRCYLHYQKAQRALKALRPRAHSLDDRIRTMEEMLAVVSADPVIDRVREISSKLDVLTGAPSPRSAKAGKKKDKTGKVAGRWFTTSDGYEVVVGRNDRENDFITFRLAGSQDVWLHAADYPGSHVVIRNPRREPVPFRTILESAEAAAFYSQARKEGKAAVHYTQKKYVSKPPRSKPGLVRLSSFKTLLVEPKKR